MLIESQVLRLQADFDSIAIWVYMFGYFMNFVQFVGIQCTHYLKRRRDLDIIQMCN